MQHGRERRQGEMLRPEDSDPPVNPQSPGSPTSQTWAPRKERSAAPPCFDSPPSPCCGTGTNELTAFRTASSERRHTKIMWRKSYSLHGKIRLCSLGKQSLIRPFRSTHSGVRWVCCQLLHSAHRRSLGVSRTAGRRQESTACIPTPQEKDKCALLKHPESSA